MRSLLTVSLALLAAACGRQPSSRPDASAPVAEPAASARPEPASVRPGADLAPAASASAAPATSAGPAVVRRLRVPGDSVASVVEPATGKGPRAVFLPGVCSNAYAYLLAFPEAARAHGGVVAIEGDGPCGSGTPGFHSFVGGAERQHARIEAALAAAGTTEIPREGITLIGYSLGASIAERLVQRYPDRYARLVVIGAPHDLATASYREARAVVTMACSLDVTGRMRQGAASLERAGVPATYREMPGCSHGNIADGERVFGEVFAWLDAHARPPRDSARPEPLTGLVAEP